MKNKTKSTVILCLYIILMLLICLLAIQVLKKALPSYEFQKNDVITEISYVTEVVYIPIYSETQIESETSFEDDDVKEYIVKSYEGKIGIFTNDDNLIRVLDVYIKTLPKTDQALLGEGLYVKSETELYELIEDYTG